MRAPKVSVILPVYNVEPYIGRCIESLRAQTLTELEFIFVDDCSTDGSMAAVEAWAAEDGRVRILRNEENLGSGPSRNRGIEIARGEYLSFVDPDDYAASDFYELLYAAATADGGHDIAKGRCCLVDEDSGIVGPPESRQNEDIRKHLNEQSPLYLWLHNEHWTALWKRSLFDDPKVRYGTSITAQDTTFQLKACFRTNDIVFADDALYYYVQLPSSATHRSLKIRTQGELDSLEEKLSFLLSEGMDRDGADYFRRRIDNFLKRFQIALVQEPVSRDEMLLIPTRLMELLERILEVVPQAREWAAIEAVSRRLSRILPRERSAEEPGVRISVILPIYNVEPYIERCIASLRTQLLDGVEFIFVDDCSTDGSMAAVEAWAADDERVRILRNEENLGPGPSRNRGIEAARGEYLSFVDPDDYLGPSFYELLYAAAVSGGRHDIAKGTRRIVDESGDPLPPHDKPLKRHMCEQLGRGERLYAAFTYEHQAALYRRSLFADGSARYGTSRNSEDTTFLLACCYQTEDIVFERASTYFYVQHEQSSVRRDGRERCNSEIDAAEEKIDFLEARAMDAEARRYMRVQIHTCLRRFQALLGEGLVSREDFRPVADRLTELLRRIPRIDRECRDRPQLAQLLAGSPLITPDNRRPGEGDIRISVILPVCNVEPYIGRCIESLRAQLLDGLEFIFIDDCSTDGSMAAVEAWAAEDGRVRILRNEENLGAGPSRNRGIGAARGAYLSFVDPDDYISLDFYELLYAAAVSGDGHDIAKGSCWMAEPCGIPAEPAFPLNDKIEAALTKHEPLYTVFRYEHWSAIYRRSLFDDGTARYGTSRSGQDVTFLLRCTRQTNDLVLAGRAVYYYVQRPDSAVSGDGRERTSNELDMLSEMVDFLTGPEIGNDERTYLLGQARNVLDRFVDLLDEGRVCREDYAAVAERMAQILEGVPGIAALAGEAPLVADALDGCPLTTTGKRAPGEDDVRVSVILPVYNVKPYIGRCIASLRAQLLDGLEFIIVDDCSTDGSMAAVEAWAAEDNRVRILRNEENLGAGPSRNRGIEAARGAYLSFVDPDDYVSASFYVLLYAAALSGGGHDMAKGTREVISADGSRSRDSSQRMNRRILYALRKHAPLFTAFTGEHQTAIYRRSLFEAGARNGSTIKDEDTTFQLSACLLSKDIVLEENAVYRYVIRDGSLVHSHRLDTLMSELDAIEEKVALLEARPHDKYTKHYLESKVALRLTNYYLGIRYNPALADGLEAYTQKLEDMVKRLPALSFLKSVSPGYRALVEHCEVLPFVSALPEELRDEGARAWLAFIERTPYADLVYCRACAQAQEASLRHVARAQGLRSFSRSYLQTLKRLEMLPLRQRAAIALELHRQLASWRNIRIALRKLTGRS